jgi:lysophospholipase L1-like esterase
MNPQKSAIKLFDVTQTDSPPVRVVAVGDCNTITANPHQGTVADGLSQALRKLGVNVQLVNLSGGMRTTREGLAHLKDYPEPADIAVVNFGLVDSWSTSIPRLYVHYYPDTVVRKRIRKLVKFVKRRLRSGIGRRLVPFGRVVSVPEYVANVSAIVQLLKARNSEVQVFLWGTVPVTDRPFRNPDIIEYNAALQQVATDQGVHYVDSATVVAGLNPEDRFIDGTHLSPAAVALIGEYVTRACYGDADRSVGAQMRRAA